LEFTNTWVSVVCVVSLWIIL